MLTQQASACLFCRYCGSSLGHLLSKARERKMSKPSVVIWFVISKLDVYSCVYVCGGGGGGGQRENGSFK